MVGSELGEVPNLAIYCDPQTVRRLVFLHFRGRYVSFCHHGRNQLVLEIRESEHMPHTKAYSRKNYEKDSGVLKQIRLSSDRGKCGAERYHCYGPSQFPWNPLHLRKGSLHPCSREPLTALLPALKGASGVKSRFGILLQVTVTHDNSIPTQSCPHLRGLYVTSASWKYQALYCVRLLTATMQHCKAPILRVIAISGNPHTVSGGRWSMTNLRQI